MRWRLAVAAAWTAASSILADAAVAVIADQQSSEQTMLMYYLRQIDRASFDSDPPVVVPGDWLTDKGQSIFFLPMQIPRRLPLPALNLRTDGESLLMRVEEKLNPRQQDGAERKFRLIMAAFRSESEGDTAALTARLEEWQSYEGDRNVQKLIKDALAGLHADAAAAVSLVEHGSEGSEASLLQQERRYQLRGSPGEDDPFGTESAGAMGPFGGSSSSSGYTFNTGADSSSPSDLISIPLKSQLLQQQDEPRATQFLQQDAPVPDLAADDLLPVSATSAFQNSGSRAAQKAYVKEMLRMPLPYATTPGHVYAVLTSPGFLVVCVNHTAAALAHTGHIKKSHFLKVPVYEAPQEQAQQVKLHASPSRKQQAATAAPQSDAKTTKVASLKREEKPAAPKSVSNLHDAKDLPPALKTKHEARIAAARVVNGVSDDAGDQKLGATDSSDADDSSNTDVTMDVDDGSPESEQDDEHIAVLRRSATTATTSKQPPVVVNDDRFSSLYDNYATDLPDQGYGYLQLRGQAKGH